MSFKTRDGKTHQSSVLVSESGLPFDGIATVSGSYIFLDGNQPLTYSAPTVTLPAGFDLTEVSTAKARYTGKYVLITNDGKIYYIDRSSIDIINRTFSVSVNDKLPVPPALIDLSAGWTVAEANIVNRMATTSAAKIDSVEFRDLHFQFQLDGDPVSLVNKNGVKINPATEEKQDDQITELGLINDELDTITINLAQIQDDINKQYISMPTVLNTTLATVDTEYSILLPATARKFRLKSRLPALLEYSYQSGGAYQSLKYGTFLYETDLSLSANITIYIKSSKPNTVIETVYWE